MFTTEYVEPTLKRAARKFGENRNTDWQVAYAILELAHGNLEIAADIWDSPTREDEAYVAKRARRLAMMEAALHGYDYEEEPFSWGVERI